VKAAIETEVSPTVYYNVDWHSVMEKIFLYLSAHRILENYENKSGRWYCESFTAGWAGWSTTEFMFSDLTTVTERFFFLKDLLPVGKYDEVYMHIVCTVSINKFS
jgi:hypothetical protein